MGYREAYESWLNNPYFDEDTKQELRNIANDEKEMDFTYDVCVHFRTWRMWKTDSYRKS